MPSLTNIPVESHVEQVLSLGRLDNFPGDLALPTATQSGMQSVFIEEQQTLRGFHSHRSRQKYLDQVFYPSSVGDFTGKGDIIIIKQGEMNGAR